MDTLTKYQRAKKRLGDVATMKGLVIARLHGLTVNADLPRSTEKWDYAVEAIHQAIDELFYNELERAAEIVRKYEKANLEMAQESVRGGCHA